MPRRSPPAAERFWAKVDKISDPEGCWLWTGSLCRKGYARFRYQGRAALASRAIWQMENGPIPEDLCICHKCDNPRCVRVSHLFLGTRADNSADMAQKKRSTLGERNPNRKLTEAEVRSIRALVKSGMTQVAVARAHSVTQSLVSHIVRRKIWSHV